MTKSQLQSALHKLMLNNSTAEIVRALARCEQNSADDCKNEITAASRCEYNRASRVAHELRRCASKCERVEEEEA